MRDAILGIDIAKADFHAALLVGDSIRSKSFPNNAKGFVRLNAWFVNRGIGHVHACLEATGSYGEGLAVYLTDAGHTVSVVNPSRVKGYAQSELARTKTDAVDAAIIARFCRALHPEPWIPPAAELRVLQALVRRLASLEAMRQQERNRQQMPGLPAEVQRSVTDVITALSREIQQLERTIADHFDQHPHLRHKRELLTSIPGVGETTAARLLGEMLDFQQFSSAKQVAAYAGLSPRQRQSGSSIRGKTRLAKTGNPHLRKALFFPAIVARTHNPLLKAFADRLAAAGKHKMAIVGALMRKLLHIAYGVLKSGKPFNPAYENCDRS